MMTDLGPVSKGSLIKMRICCSSSGELFLSDLESRCCKLDPGSGELKMIFAGEAQVSSS